MQAVKPTGLMGVLVFVLAPQLAAASPTLDGAINAGEGWIHLTEDPFAQPVSGGQTLFSDLVGEVSGSHRWDDALGQDRDLGAPRGDTQNLFITGDATFFYVAVDGPTAPFATWSNPGSDENDVGLSERF